MNFKQNIEKNRLKIKELPERKIGEKKSKIGSSLSTIKDSVYCILHTYTYITARYLMLASNVYNIA